MKIDGQKSIVDSSIYIQSPEKKDEVRSQQTVQNPSKEVSREKVSLSEMAKDIQKILKALKNTPEIKEEKVAELKSSIEAGTYSVNETLVVNKMVREFLLDEIL